MQAARPRQPADARRIRRRDALAVLGAALGSAVAWPRATAAQPAAKAARLGVLLYSTPKGDPNLASFLHGLADHGYVEGRNLTIEYRYAEGRPERLAGLAEELVRLKPDLLFILGGDVTVQAMAAARTMPVLFTSSADPVQLGFVASLARPGGNATGVTLLLDDLASKRLELLKEAAPHISRVAFVWNPDHVDNELRQAEHAARPLGIELLPAAMHGPDELDGALAAARNGRPDALYVVSSRQTVRSIPRFVAFATDHRLPLAGGWGAWAQAGGLLTYGPNLNEMMHQTANLAARILHGAKPAELPVEQPTRFELIINLRTARTLGLTLPATLLARADEVIE
jgi:putative ABC transport system substrate-binding protein